MSELARAASAGGGDLVLRTRADGAVELRVDGVFVMDTALTSSERALAELALAASPRPERVLVGGLGLAGTLSRVLADGRVREVSVVELEPAVVGWLRGGLVQGADVALADPRVDVEVGDVRDRVASAATGSVDVLLLDVDNGPDFLVHEHNAALYREGFLRTCAAALAGDGVLALWSMSRSDALVAALAAVFSGVREHRCPVRLPGRAEAYVVTVATGPAAAPDAGDGGAHG